MDAGRRSARGRARPAHAHDAHRAARRRRRCPRSFAAVDAYDRLTAAFPQEGTTVDLVVKAPADRAADVDAALRAALPAAMATGQVAAVDTPRMKASTDRTVHVLQLPRPAAGVRSEARRRRRRHPRSGRPGGDSSSWPASPGSPCTSAARRRTATSRRWLDGRLPWVMAFVLVLTFVVMLVSFGSPWLALVTVGLNLLSVGAAYGVMTLVFQHTWAEGLLGFTSIGSIAAWLPLLMFVMLFGLSMDYHVFVVSRVREAFTAGASPRDAVRLGVARSAGVVTSAAAVMVAVFAIFATLSTLEMKQLGRRPGDRRAARRHAGPRRAAAGGARAARPAGAHRPALGAGAAPLSSAGPEARGQSRGTVTGWRRWSAAAISAIRRW